LTSPAPPDTRVPASAIDTAPDSATPNPSRVTPSKTEFDQLIASYGELQNKYEGALAETDRLRGSAEAARAQLIKPYAWAVFWFVCAYGAVVAILLVAEGFGKAIGFNIDNAVMGVLVGSTAVSAIGLVLTVVKGLFPVAKG